MDTKNEIAKLTEDEYNELGIRLLEKYDSGQVLTIDEQYSLCDYATLSFLVKCRLPACRDEFFMRCFLYYTSGQNVFGKFSSLHLSFFESLVYEWKGIVSKTNNKEELMKLTAEETRKELKKLRQQNIIVNRNFSLEQFRKAHFDIYAWSKYRYLSIKRVIHKDYSHGQYRIALNGHVMVIDGYSLIHISTRHLGLPMKPYTTEKDHFTEEFSYDNLHLKLEEIFSKIDLSGLYVGQDQLKISFRFKGVIYRVYFKQRTFQKKGVASQTLLRLETFFPVGEIQMLQELSKLFIEKIVNKDLSVFIQK